MKHEKVDSVNRDSLCASAEVFDRVHRIMHLFRSQQYRGLRRGPNEMTHLEGKLLGFFAERPGATLSDLVGHLGRDKGQMARLIKNLKEEGFLRPHANERKDRRSISLELTRKGRSVHVKLHRESERLARLAVTGLRAEERTLLLKLLKKVQSNLESSSGR